jgi:hypothetical protein
MKFKKGDILEFIGVPTYSAKKGAKAICVYVDNYVYVEWIRNGLDNDQDNGGYEKEWFTKVEEVSTQEENRIFEENKKVMKFDLEKGKERLVEYFEVEFERASMYSLEYIKDCDDLDLIESEVKSFRAYKEENNKVISRIERASTLALVLSALDDTILEDDDETILSFFIEGLN